MKSLITILWTQTFFCIHLVIWTNLFFVWYHPKHFYTKIVRLIEHFRFIHAEDSHISALKSQFLVTTDKGIFEVALWKCWATWCMAGMMLRWICEVYLVYKIKPGHKLNLMSWRSKCDPEASKCLVFVKLASILSCFSRWSIEETAHCFYIHYTKRRRKSSRSATVRWTKTRNVCMILFLFLRNCVETM